jgi:hypothetical protein
MPMKKLVSIAGVAGAAAWVYRSHLRDRHLNWGAAPEEVEMWLPGDEFVAEPDVVANRAVRIVAPAAAVWPWLVQMGPGRAGAPRGSSAETGSRPARRLARAWVWPS